MIRRDVRTCHVERLLPDSGRHLFCQMTSFDYVMSSDHGDTRHLLSKNIRYMDWIVSVLAVLAGVIGIAGSILPFSSEVVLTALVEIGLDPLYCLIWASIGNTIGGLICYWLGYLGNMRWIERWLRIKKEKLDKVEKFVRRYGALMGLFGVLPFIGEAIIVMLGLMRSNVYYTTLTMFIGKSIRYALLILAIEGVNSLL